VNLIRARLPILACVLVLCGILYAGLTPFHKPKNAVTWLADQNGLRFARYGTVVSSGSFQMATSENEASSSLEIWLQPDLTDSSKYFLAFSTPENPEKFLLQQYYSSLILNRRARPGDRMIHVGVDAVFKEAKPVFITITSAPEGSAVYIDGVLATRFSGFRLGRDFTGQLVLGTSPVEDESWKGQLRGLAVYRRELMAAKVRQHYETWTKQGRPEVVADEGIALYLFNEHSGSVAHNTLRLGIDLQIPEKYTLLHQRFLEPFWEEYAEDRSYWKDATINIVGLIPLGFVFYAYWSSVRPIRRAILVTTLLGFAVSLTIELLQSLLPTRNSGTTDLFTNTLGTFFGVKICGTKTAKALLQKIYLTRTDLEMGRKS